MTAKTENEILAEALIILSKEIQSPDNIPSLAIREGADRIMELDSLVKKQAKELVDFTNPKNWTRAYKFDGQLASNFALYKHGFVCQRQANFSSK